MILGAFLGGALISLLADRGASDLHHKLDVIGYAFFIPIFFIMVGVRFDLAALLESPQTLLLVPLLLVLAYAVKFAAALVFRACSFSWRETLAGGRLALLSPEPDHRRLGHRPGVGQSSTRPPTRPSSWWPSSPPRSRRCSSTASRPAVTDRSIASSSSSAPAAGAAAGPAHPAATARRSSWSITRPRRVASSARRWACPSSRPTPPIPRYLGRLEPETIRAVAVLLPEDETNLEVCRLLRDELGIQRVISRVHDATQTAPFHRSGGARSSTPACRRWSSWSTCCSSPASRR